MDTEPLEKTISPEDIMATAPPEIPKSRVIEMSYPSVRVTVANRFDHPDDPLLSDGIDYVYAGKTVRVGGKLVVRAPEALGAGGRYVVYRAYDTETNEPLIYRIAQDDINNRFNPLFWQRCEDLEFHPSIVATSTNGRAVIAYKERIQITPDDPDWKVEEFGDNSDPEELLRLAILNYEAGKSWIEKGFAYTDWQEKEMIRLGKNRKVKAWRVIDFEPRVIYPKELRKAEFEAAVNRVQFSQQEEISSTILGVRTLNETIAALENELQVAINQRIPPISDETVETHAGTLHKEYLAALKAKPLVQKLKDWMKVAPVKTLDEFIYETRKRLEESASANHHRQISELRASLERQGATMRQRIEELQKNPDIFLLCNSKNTQTIKDFALTYNPENDEKFIQQVLDDGGDLALYNLGLTSTIATEVSELPSNLYRNLDRLRVALREAGFRPTPEDFAGSIAGSFIKFRIEPVLNKYAVTRPSEVNEIRHQIAEIIAAGTGAQQFLELESVMTAMKALSDDLKNATVDAREGELRIYENN